MIISCANLKGGVGKTKINALLANFIAYKENSVAFLDCDVNQLSSNVLDHVPNPYITHIPYDLKFGDMAHYALELEKEYDYVIIDLPGTIQQEGVLELLSICDFIVVPTTPEMEDLDSTITFTQSLSKLIPDVPFKVLMNNYEVQYFGMKEHEENGFSSFKNSLGCEIFELGIRKSRSYLNQNFVFGEFTAHESYKKVLPAIEAVYNDILKIKSEVA